MNGAAEVESHMTVYNLMVTVPNDNPMLHGENLEKLFQDVISAASGSSKAHSHEVEEPVTESYIRTDENTFNESSLCKETVWDQQNTTENYTEVVEERIIVKYYVANLQIADSSIDQCLEELKEEIKVEEEEVVTTTRTVEETIEANNRKRKWTSDAPWKRRHSMNLQSGKDYQTLVFDMFCIRCGESLIKLCFSIHSRSKERGHAEINIEG